MKKTALIFLLILIVGVGCTPKKEADNANDTMDKETSPSAQLGELSDEDVKAQIDDILNVLMVIHYVSIDGREITDVNSVITDTLVETMNDLNKLKGVLYKTEALTKSKNEVISTTGLVLNVNALSLIKAHESWIQYLRGVDIQNIDLPEFQYQMALFQSSTHDAYLSLIEGASLLPMVTVKFSQEGGEKNSFNEELENHFLAKIDQLFDDILKDDELFHKETKNRYAIAILIRGYKDFFRSAN